jgi:hypothetical protein
MREARRLDGWTVGAAATLAATVLLTAYPSNRLSAQVGYDPAHSPYRDVRRGAVAVVTFGYLGGSRGSVGVGLSNGATGGIRYEPQFGAMGASLGLAYGRTTSFVVDPTKDSLSRKSGPFDNTVVLADAGLQLVLTGRKTWRGFAPYVGGALGVAVGSTVARDTSGYKFGTKITLAPNAGLRWYPARRLSVRGDFRLLLWKLKYPVSYRVPGPAGCTPDTPGCTRVLQVTDPPDEWTAHPWATIGVGWTF